MNKDSIIDSAACILFRIVGPIIRVLPLGFSFFLARRLGDLFYCFDLRHKALAYSHIKTALGKELSAGAITNLTHRFYRAFAQNLIEIFLIPKMDKNYMDRYLQSEGFDYVKEGFSRGKGVILLSMHAGCWELSNIICVYLGFPFVLFVREQKFPRLDKLLNAYRREKSYKIIEKDSGARELIRALKNNEAIGMMADQGGRAGTIVRFFGREASMPAGAVRFALKYDAAIIPGYYTRVKGAQNKVIFNPIFEIKRSGDLEKDVQDNLQRLMGVYEENIRRYPQEYLWTYKIWKYGRDKNILILSDGRAGHFRQAQATANAVACYLKDKGINSKIETREIKFKTKLSKTVLTLSSGLAGRYHCQGCLWCLKNFLEKDVYRALATIKPDVIISCGASLAPVNYVLSRENLAKSIVVMRPSLLSTGRFDLVIMPWHDHPPKKKNVVITDGALNLIDEEYLRGQSERLSRELEVACLPGRQGSRESSFYIGILIGGDTKNFHLDKNIVSEVMKQVKSVAEKYDAEILLTTSRRTSGEIEESIKREFKDYPRCRLLIIANEKNIPEAVGGILGLSKIVVVSPESISMISEAASSGRQILVFSSRVSPKHARFLRHMFKQRYIYLANPDDIVSAADNLLKDNPRINILKDRAVIRQALEKII